jgi:hypothetical protein
MNLLLLVHRSIAERAPHRRGYCATGARPGRFNFAGEPHRGRRRRIGWPGSRGGRNVSAPCPVCPCRTERAVPGDLMMPPRARPRLRAAGLKPAGLRIHGWGGRAQTRPQPRRRHAFVIARIMGVRPTRAVTDGRRGTLSVRLSRPALSLRQMGSLSRQARLQRGDWIGVVARRVRVRRQVSASAFWYLLGCSCSAPKTGNGTQRTESDVGPTSFLILRTR